MFVYIYMGVSKNRGKTPKMDGENKGKPYWNGWFGGFSHIFGNTQMKFPCPKRNKNDHHSAKVQQKGFCDKRKVCILGSLNDTPIRHVLGVHYIYIRIYID